MNTGATKPELHIQQFLERLDEQDAPVDFETLVDWMRSLEVGRDDVEPWIHFSDELYQRNLIRKGKHYEALLLCFNAGQRTPIHDHAGSACGVKVVHGSAIETFFDRTSDGWIFANGSRHLTQGGAIGSFDTDTHQLSNLQNDQQQLMTLHVYSPPLELVGNYSLTENQIQMVRPTFNIVGDDE